MKQYKVKPWGKGKRGRCFETAKEAVAYGRVLPDALLYYRLVDGKWRLALPFESKVAKQVYLF